jgi:hypothetical protein
MPLVVQLAPAALLHVSRPQHWPAEHAATADGQLQPSVLTVRPSTDAPGAAGGKDDEHVPVPAHTPVDAPFGAMLNSASHTLASLLPQSPEARQQDEEPKHWL